VSILFFGSHQYSLYPLNALYKAGHKVLAVVTQPDRPVGRHQTLTPTPVKIWAQNHKIPAFTPKNKEELIKYFSRCQAIPPSRWTTLTPVDLAITCVYGMIIPRELLSLPKYGFLNIHPSLLPKYRGASPAQGAIIAGEKETGVTIFQMDEKLDHGPIIAQEKEVIKENDTAETLYHRLFKKGAELLVKTVPFWVKNIEFKTKDLRSKTKNVQSRKERPCEANRHKHKSTMAAAITDLCFGIKDLELFIPPKPQDDNRASYTRMLKRDDGFIPWEFVKAAINGECLNKKIKVDFIRDNQNHPFSILPALPVGRHSIFYIHNFIRAFSPWPGAWTEIKLKVKSEKLKVKRRLKLLKSRLENGRLVLDEVQLEGEKPTEFKNNKSFM